MSVFVTRLTVPYFGSPVMTGASSPVTRAERRDACLKGPRRNAQPTHEPSNRDQAVTAGHVSLPGPVET